MSAGHADRDAAAREERPSAAGATEEALDATEENVRRSLRRGNINFEFLNPREAAAASPAPETVERRRSERKDKRGLFNRGRPPRPVTHLSMLVWGLLLLVSAAGLVWVFAYGESVFWLLGLPLLVASGCWSLFMLALFAGRPR